MYLEELKGVIENSMRSMAMAMDVCRHDQVDKAIMVCDQPMQDHFAECAVGIHPYENSSVEDCCKYMVNLYKAVCWAWDHECAVSKNKMDPDVAVIADMILTFPGTKYSADLIACAQEVNSLHVRLLKPYMKREATDEECKKVASEFLKGTIEISKKHGYDLTEDKGFSLPLGYLHEWIVEKVKR